MMDLQPPEGIGSRDKILWAAATMLGDEPGAAMSVREVAKRAGVSTGSLQHHFPTKRALMDEVMALVYDLVLPESSMHDTSIPARERLAACLQRLLTSVGTDPREAWRATFERYIEAVPSDAARAEYLAIERELRRRIEYCLNVLQDEGSLGAGDNDRRARFLFTVVNGLSIAQALPADESRLPTEVDALYTAVDCVLADDSDMR